MTRLLPVLFILAFAATGYAQVQQNPTEAFGQVVVLSTGNTASNGVSVVGMGITAFQLTCYPLGTVTTAGVTLQTSPDGTTWTTLIASTDCSVPNQSTVTVGTTNQVRVNATTFSAAGTVRVTWRGSASSSDSSGVVSGLDAIETILDSSLTELEEINTNTADTSDVGVLPRATNTGGVTTCDYVSTASTNSFNCTDTATGVYTITVISTSTTLMYLRLYNLASAPTCSVATGYVSSLPIPPASASGQAGGFVLTRAIPNTGDFTTGVSFCITGGSSSVDNTSATQGAYVHIDYKEAP